jgi:hypothetical protein
MRRATGHRATTAQAEAGLSREELEAQSVTELPRRETLSIPLPVVIADVLVRGIRKPPTGGNRPDGDDITSCAGANRCLAQSDNGRASDGTCAPRTLDERGAALGHGTLI